MGDTPPAMGAILQEGIDVLVVLNALRAGRLREPETSTEVAQSVQTSEVSTLDLV